MSIFSKIINKEIPAYIIYEDDLVISFLDISQATIGHTLVVPKQEFSDILELDESISNHIFGVTTKISKGLMKAFSADGINILSNNKAAAGQTIFHFHIHIIPRYINDDLKLTLNTNNQTNKEEFEKRAHLIRLFLKNFI